MKLEEIKMGNKNTQESKGYFNKETLEIINAVLGILSPIIGSLYKFAFKHELPKIIFVILIILVFRYGVKYLVSIICNLYKNINDYYDKSDQLYNNCKNNKEKKGDLYFKTKQLRKKTRKRFFKYLLPRLTRSIIATILILILFLINPINAKAFRQDIVEIVEILFEHPTKDISESSPKQQNPDAENGSASDNMDVENEKEKKPPGYKFILKHPDKTFELDSLVESQVYFYNDDAKKSINDLVTEYILNMQTNRKVGINTPDILYNEENAFKEKVAEYISIEYMDDWCEVAPSSDELDTYILKRETLVDGEQGCYELWWRLANDYQYYAQEYEMQTRNESAVLYYYTMSIYCCMEALKYEMTTDTHDMIYHYMATRYHDIYRDDCIIPSPYKNNARAIYGVLEPNVE